MYMHKVLECFEQQTTPCQTSGMKRNRRVLALVLHSRPSAVGQLDCRAPVLMLDQPFSFAPALAGKP